MKVVIITCDNCGNRIPGDKDVRHVLGHEWCENCSTPGATRNLIGLPFDKWPLLIRRHDLRLWLEWRDKKAPDAEKEIRMLRDRIAFQELELEEIRRVAAEGYAEGDMARALSDVASGARRAVPA